MKEQKLIAETQDTTWIWIVHAMIANWLNYTIMFNFTSGYYVQLRYRSRKRTKNYFFGGRYDNVTVSVRFCSSEGCNSVPFKVMEQIKIFVP